MFSLGLHSAALKLPWANKPLPSEGEELNRELLNAAQPPTISIASLPTPDPSSANLSGETKNSSSAAFTSLPAAPTSLQQTLPVQPALAVQPIQPDGPQTLAPAELSSPPQSQPEIERLPPNSPVPSPETGPEHGVVVHLSDDFPHLAGAQSGCYGLASCRQLNGNYRQAARLLLAQMTDQGYQLAERGDIDNTGHRVFEVIAPNEPNVIYYLNVFSPDVGSTVYVVTVNILSLEQLKQLSS